MLATLFPLAAASAQLGFSAVGPVDPNNGFPKSYTDTNGLSLDACLTDPILCGLAAPVSLGNPGQPFPADYVGTFPEEVFFNRCVAKMTTSGTNLATLVIALEGAFANGPVAAGDQITFGRVRIRAAGLVAGQTYTVTTPVGVFVFVATANAVGINNTDQIGGVAGEFTGALGSHAGPFLTWDTNLPVLDAAGREYIGNPGLDHTITGSPSGNNFFRIDGPNVGGPGVNRIQTNLFQVIGLKSPPPPAAPVAAFNAAPISGNAPLNVSFTDASTGTITARSWTLGDGATSTLQNPTHSYAAGAFSVSLTVSGPGGSNTLTKPNLIVVGGAPPGGLTLSNPVPGIAGVPNTLTITGARPNSNIGFYAGMVPGSSIVRNGRCPLGIPIGLGTPFRSLGSAKSNAAGVATLVTTPPAGAVGKVFHFQAVEPASCSTSNMVSDTL